MTNRKTKYVISVKVTKVTADIPKSIPLDEALLDDYLSNTARSEEVYEKPLYLADTKEDAEGLAGQIK